MSPNADQRYTDGWAKLCRRTALNKLAVMKGTDVKVYVALLARSDTSTGVCYPSFNRIAADVGLSRRTVINAVQRLEGAGLIEIVRGKQHNSDAWSVNHYRVLGGEAACTSSESASTTVVNEDTLGGEAESTSVVNQDAPEQENQVIREPASADAAVAKGSASQRNRGEPDVSPSRGEMSRAIWQAIADHLDYEPLTESEKGKWRHGIKELQDAGVTEADIADLVRGYEQILGYRDMNPKSLAANLGRIRAAVTDPDQFRRMARTGASKNGAFENEEKPTMTDIEAIIELGLVDHTRGYSDQLRRLATAAGHDEYEQSLYHEYLRRTEPTIRAAYQQAWDNGDIVRCDDIPEPLPEGTTFEEYRETHNIRKAAL